MTHFTLRHATCEDISDLLELIRLKAAFDGCPEAVEATPEALGQALFCENPLAYVLLVDVDGVAAGMASYHRIFSTFLARPGLWLDDLYLRDAYRGQRLGKALMIELCRIGVQIGAGRMDWTVDISNDRAIGFYEHLGAKRQTHVQLCRCDRPTLEYLARH